MNDLTWLDWLGAIYCALRIVWLMRRIYRDVFRRQTDSDKRSR